MSGLRRVLYLDLGREKGSPEGHQALAYVMHQKRLESVLGIEVRGETVTTLEALNERLTRDQWSDAVMVMASWRLPVEALGEVFSSAKALRPDRKLIFIDYYAPTSTRNFSLLPVVDVYAKRQILRDRSQYAKTLAGGMVFSDFLSTKLDFDLKGWNFGSVPDPQHLGKLVLGWNLGVTPEYRAMCRLSWVNPIPYRNRPFDISARFELNDSSRPREWYEQYRDWAWKIIESLSHEHKLTGHGRILRRLYLMEMSLTKLTFCPFGWGELTFRDFEAVAAGSLLVKPDVSHLETSPDIFEPHKTYVPVRWDLSDLTDTIRYYLKNPKDASQIAREGHRRLSAYYQKDGFVEDFRRVLWHEAAGTGA